MWPITVTVLKFPPCLWSDAADVGSNGTLQNRVLPALLYYLTPGWAGQTNSGAGLLLCSQVVHH